MSGLQVGHEEDGFRYIGGDPGDPTSWVPVGREQIGGPSVGGRVVSKDLEPPEQSFGRFLQGARTRLLPTTEDLGNIWEALKGMGASGTPETGPNPPADNPLSNLLSGIVDQQVGQFKQIPEESGIGMKAVRAAGGAVPLVGPPVADAIGDITEGDVAGGAGQLTGELLPFARPFRMLGKARKARSLKKVQSQMESLLQPATDEARKLVVKNAEEVSRTLGVGGYEKLERSAKTASDQANKTLNKMYDLAEARGAKVDLADAAAEVRSSAKRINLPEVDDAVDWSKYHTLDGEKKLQFLHDSVNTSNAKKAVPDNLNREHIAAVERQAKDIESINELFERAVPVKEARTLMQSARSGATAAYKSDSVMAGKVAAAEAAGDAISGIVQRTYPTFFAEANASSHLWTTVRNELKQEARKAAKSPKVPAANILAMRAVGGGVLGGVMGGGLGMEAAGGMATAGAILGSGYGMFQVYRDILQSPLWRSLSAKGRLKLIEALPGGTLAKATIAGRYTVPALREEDE